MTKHYKSPYTPTKLIWLTDLHLDRAAGEDRTRLLNELSNRDYDAAVITGDIATATSVCDHLESLAAACYPRPVYFVLGNHDFYFAAMSQTYDRVASLSRSVPNLRHLHHTGPISLNRHTALIGHHGWADARCGWGSNTVINSPDHRHIPDFQNLSREERYRKMEILGRQATNAIRIGLLSALRQRKQVVVATHVPPFPSTVHFDGRICGDTHMPHFANISLGAMLIGIAKRNRQRITVLSGHTHSPITDTILANIQAHVGGAWKGTSEAPNILQF